MIESIVVKGIIFCLVAGFIVYVLICACAELMASVMSEEDAEDRRDDKRGGE